MRFTSARRLTQLNLFAAEWLDAADDDDGAGGDVADFAALSGLRDLDISGFKGDALHLSGVLAALQRLAELSRLCLGDVDETTDLLPSRLPDLCGLLRLRELRLYRRQTQERRDHHTDPAVVQWVCECLRACHALRRVHTRNPIRRHLLARACLKPHVRPRVEMNFRCGGHDDYGCCPYLEIR